MGGLDYGNPDGNPTNFNVGIEGWTEDQPFLEQQKMMENERVQSWHFHVTQNPQTATLQRNETIFRPSPPFQGATKERWANTAPRKSISRPGMIPAGHGLGSKLAGQSEF